MGVLFAPFFIIIGGIMKLADFAESARALFKRLARMRANKSSKVRNLPQALESLHLPKILNLCSLRSLRSLRNLHHHKSNLPQNQCPHFASWLSRLRLLLLAFCVSAILWFLLWSTTMLPKNSQSSTIN